MDLYDLLKFVADKLDALKIEYFVTGSLASMFYGEPRLTNDIDIVADIEENHIKGIISEFPADKFYISEEAIKEVYRLRRQFNIIHPSSGLKVDIVIQKNDSFDKSRFERIRKDIFIKGRNIKFASPEDVIIMKMKYYHEEKSDKHLRDIAGILKISPQEVNKEYIRNWASKMNLTEIWNQILQKVR